MDAVDVARWQFAITTVYHFLFVPITIGMSLVVAIFHTQWLRTRNPEYSGSRSSSGSSSSSTSPSVSSPASCRSSSSA